MLKNSTQSSSWNLNLGSWSGVSISLNVTFLLLPLWLSFLLYKTTSSILPACALFSIIVLSVFLHEAAHLLAAIFCKQKIRTICLFPFGGVTNLSSELEGRVRFLEELIVRISGPLVTTGLMSFLSFLMGNSQGLLLEVFSSAHHFNGLLLLFSMLPIFPLDMFPVLKKALTSDKQRASLVYSVSQWTAVFLLALALFQRDEVIVLYTATLLLLTVREQLYQRAYSIAARMKVKDVMSPREELFSLHHGDTVKKHLEAIIRTYQPYIPILHGTRFVGIVSRDNVLQLMADGDDHYVSEALEPSPLQVNLSDELDKTFEKLAKEQREFAVVLDQENFTGLLTKDKLTEFLFIYHIVNQSTHAGTPIDLDREL